MRRISVALLSTAPPKSLGSMGAFADLVRDALVEYAPQVNAIPVCLRDSGNGAGRGLGGRLAQLQQIVQARLRSLRVRADVYHVLDGSHAYLVGGIPWKRTLVTVHDFIPALQARGRFPVPAPGWTARRAIEMSLDRVRRAGAVHAVSQNTADDLLEVSGRTADAVFMTPLRPLAQGPDASAAHGSCDPPFVLHVGNNGFYKNRRGVVAVFAALAGRWPQLRLVLAGPAPDQDLRSVVARHGLESRVTFTLNPGDGDLGSLYREASVLLFPSLYEGQGWPTLEAMRFGCPVVCSDTAALPETVGDAALLCDPRDVDSMASAVSRVLSDSSLVSDLVDRGYRNLRRFDMSEFALKLSRLYEELSSSKV
jgi:glycosyltransferase involved in cell wall biosynthesis